MAPAYITRRGSWCPICPCKTEGIVYDYLSLNYNMKYDYHELDCTSDKGGMLKYDYLIEEFSLIIELDGNQHFKQVSNWTSPERTQELDVYKMFFSLNKGYSMIRILQEDVLYNRYDWMRVLFETIKSYEIPTLILLSTTNIYDTHINKLKEYIDKLKSTTKYQVVMMDPIKTVFEEMTYDDDEVLPKSQIQVNLLGIKHLIKI